MSKLAYSIIKDRAKRVRDLPQLRAAYDEVWAALKGRVGDREGVSVRVAALVVAVGNRRPDADSSEIARIVEKTFHVASEQE